jgi:hypothetical protein
MASQINESGRNLMLDALGNACGFLALYSDVAGTTEITGGSPAYARKAITYNAASGGSKSISNSPVFDVPAGTTVRAVGFMTAASGGVQHAVDDVTAETFAGQGTYTVTAGSVALT